MSTPKVYVCSDDYGSIRQSTLILVNEDAFENLTESELADFKLHFKPSPYHQTLEEKIATLERRIENLIDANELFGGGV